MRYFIPVIILCLYSFFYIFDFLYKENRPDDISIPTVHSEAILLKNYTSKDTSKDMELPLPSEAKLVNINKPVENSFMNATPLTFSEKMKTFHPRLSKEEILKAKVVDVIPMNIDNQDFNIIVVEKDGLTYDASDGVRIYVPFDFDKFFLEKRKMK